MFATPGELFVDLVEQADGTYFPVSGGAPYSFAEALALQCLDAGYCNPFLSDVSGRLLETIADGFWSATCGSHRRRADFARRRRYQRARRANDRF